VNQSKTRLTSKVLILTAMIVSTTFGLFFSSLPLSVAAGNTPGTKCVKAGTTAKSGSISVKCLKVGNKLIWQKATTVNVNLGKYAIGDTGPGGGKIFYVDSTGFACGPTLSSTCKYLESAPTTGKAAWKDEQYFGPVWPDLEPDATATQIGTGYKNTLAMTGLDYQNEVQTSALAYRGPKGKSDWFIPSMSELAALFAQKKMVGGFLNRSYWSSSDASDGLTYCIHFQSRELERGGGSEWISFLRPVRAF
jgi:hypothetical protein